MELFQGSEDGSKPSRAAMLFKNGITFGSEGVIQESTEADGVSSVLVLCSNGDVKKMTFSELGKLIRPKNTVPKKKVSRTKLEKKI